MSDDGQLVAGFGGQDVWLYAVGGEQAERVPVQGVSGPIQGTANAPLDSSLIATGGRARQRRPLGHRIRCTGSG